MLKLKSEDLILEKYANELVNMKKEWDSHPCNWPNNKRRMKGLKPLRGSSNINKRYKKEYIFYKEKRFDIYELLEKSIDELLKINCFESSNFLNFLHTE